MNSGDLLAMLNRAIVEKQSAHKSYEKYYEQMNNPTLKKIVEGVLQREEQHLEILNSLKESINNNGNLEAVTNLAADGLIKNTKNHEQHLEILKMVMQEAGSSLSHEDATEMVPVETEAVDLPEVDLSPYPVNRTVRKTGTTMNYSRNINNHRSVVSCSLGSPKTILKKR